MEIQFWQYRTRFMRRLQWRFKIVAANGEVLAISSESYNNQTDMHAAIRSMQLRIRDAQVVRIWPH